MVNFCVNTWEAEIFENSDFDQIKSYFSPPKMADK